MVAAMVATGRRDKRQQRFFGRVSSLRKHVRKRSH
jgi:hypothetical protein